MNRSQAMAAFGIDDDRKQRFQTIADQHLQKQYSTGIKKAARTVGKNVRTVVVNDQAALNKLHRKARVTANRIQKTYNAMLEKALDVLPEPMSETEYRNGLRPFFDTVHEYNGNSLTPYLSHWAHQSALRDFYGVNSIQATWHVASPNRPPTRGSECEVALSLAPMTTEKAIQFEFPVHNNCEHRLVPSGAKNIPKDLWLGRESQRGKKYIIERNCIDF